MKITIFTPDHRGISALTPTYNSVREALFRLNKHQPASSPEVEWIIGWNGEALAEIVMGQNLPDGVPVLPPIEDCDIREIRLKPSLDGNVGALKKALCQASTGDYLLELDSDDLLAPDALLELAICIEETGSPDFIFSDAVRVTSEGEDYIFGHNCGWTMKDQAGRKYNPTPKASAANMYKILHAPDHFRCWRREFYNQIGGHSADLKVCDDLDLL